jgi:hypothetical protein
MIRWIIVTLVGLIVMAFLRGVMGMIQREVTNMTSGAGEAEPKPGAPPPKPGASGQGAQALVRCAVCSTYSPADRLIQGKYCSQACAAKSA